MGWAQEWLGKNMARGASESYIDFPTQYDREGERRKRLNMHLEWRFTKQSLSSKGCTGPPRVDGGKLEEKS